MYRVFQMSCKEMRVFLLEIIVLISTGSLVVFSAIHNVCPVIPTQHISAAINIWNYLKLNHGIKKSDLILGLGSHDRRVAYEAARLWLDGWADYLMFSGKSGNLTRGKWHKSEAEIFKDIAVSMGVPSSQIMLETQSTNTGENIKLCYETLKQMNKIPKRMIIVQKPHMGRRTYATFMKQWPSDTKETELIVTSPNISFLEYPNDDVGDLSHVITVIVGYLQRMDLYSAMDYQIPQDIPDDVLRSYNVLIASGYYNGHLV